MISILSAFWMFVILFGLIGAMRGWAKELLVVFSVVLALFRSMCWKRIHNIWSHLGKSWRE